MTPLLERYLAELPDGLASHPECQVKGSALRSALDLVPPAVFPLADEHRERGVLPSVWYPEVHLSVLALAARELAFDSEDAFLERIFEANLEIYRSKLYYRLMTLLSPAALLKRGTINWAQFHRGSSFVLHTVEERAAEASLTFPPKLFGALHAKVFAKAFEAALHFNGATGARLAIERVEPTTVRYHATW